MLSMVIIGTNFELFSFLIEDAVYVACKSLTSVAVPTSVTSIGDSDFLGNHRKKLIVLIVLFLIRGFQMIPYSTLFMQRVVA